MAFRHFGLSSGIVHAFSPLHPAAKHPQALVPSGLGMPSGTKSPPGACPRRHPSPAPCTVAIWSSLPRSSPFTDQHSYVAANGRRRQLVKNTGLPLVADSIAGRVCCGGWLMHQPKRSGRRHWPGCASAPCSRKYWRANCSRASGQPLPSLMTVHATKPNSNRLSGTSGRGIWKPADDCWLCWLMVAAWKPAKLQP